jgi:hypothetical protein
MDKEAKEEAKEVWIEVEQEQQKIVTIKLLTDITEIIEKNLGLKIRTFDDKGEAVPFITIGFLVKTNDPNRIAIGGMGWISPEITEVMNKEYSLAVKNISYTKEERKAIIESYEMAKKKEKSDPAYV